MQRLLLFTLVITLATALAESSREDYAARFEAAWRLVDERHWDPLERGLDWHEVRKQYRPKALAAPDDEAFYAVLEAMYEEIGDDHSIFVPPARVAEIREEYGDLPCLGVFGQQQRRLREVGGVAFELVEPGVGYVRLADLVTPGVAADLAAAVRELAESNPIGIVLDIRGNPGGRLVEMMQAAGVFTSGFLWRTITRWTLPLPYPAIGAAVTDLPLAILIDGDVHSAAEGLAGGLQARGRATIVGETTAGNVEAVLPFCLRDGSQAWIATGVLAPLTGPTWEGRGVEPDISVKAEDALEAAIAHLASD